MAKEMRRRQRASGPPACNKVRCEVGAFRAFMKLHEAIRLILPCRPLLVPRAHIPGAGGKAQHQNSARGAQHVRVQTEYSPPDGRFQKNRKYNVPNHSSTNERFATIDTQFTKEGPIS